MNYQECFNRLTRSAAHYGAASVTGPHSGSLQGVSFDGKLTGPLQAFTPLAFIQTDLTHQRTGKWRAT
jgi:hypothetical protein